MRTSPAIIALVLLSSGCVCFPFATPPVELSAGVAPATDEQQVGVAAPIDAAVKPAAAFTRFWDRRFDAGFGYRFVPNTLGSAIHGPTLQASYLAPVSVRSPVDGESDLGLRFGFTGLGNVAVGGALDGLGYGATFRFSAEWVGFDNGPYDSCTYASDEYEYQHADLDGDGIDDDDSYSCTYGTSWGENGIGLFAEASYVELGTRSIGWLGFGLTLKLPAAAGVVIAPLFD